ncbi:Na+ ATPase, partial [Gryganskiella cystojenkinii]
GLFSFEVILDMFVYGIAMGGLTFANFCIVLFGFGHGDLGYDCNSHYSPSCIWVFRARATCYACLTFVFLAHVINCRSFREPGWTPTNLATMKHNKMLWISLVVGSILIFPVIYIPGLNHNVFKHSAISYEWGLVIATLIIFIMFSEAYKMAKRRFMKPLVAPPSASLEMERMRTAMSQTDSLDMLKQ